MSLNSLQPPLDVDHAPLTGVIDAHPRPADRVLTVDNVFERAAAGHPCWVRTHGCDRRMLPVQRWMGNDDCSPDDRSVDEALLDVCTGPTIDLGCGPGRLTAALMHRGITAVGVDSSSRAIALCIARGATALHQDLFAPVPHTGHWRHVILADGNIGIGDDPARLLRRAAQLLGVGGTLVVETGPPEAVRRTHTLRLESGTAVGPWFTWGTIGSTALIDMAQPVGLHIVDVTEVSGRFITVLARTSDPARRAASVFSRGERPE